MEDFFVKSKEVYTSKTGTIKEVKIEYLGEKSAWQIEKEKQKAKGALGIPGYALNWGRRVDIQNESKIERKLKEIKKNESFDWELSFQDEEYLNFLDKKKQIVEEETENKKKILSRTEKALNEEYKKIYGKGYAIISKMEGFKIGKAMSKEGNIQPVEGKKVRFIGDTKRGVEEMVEHQNQKRGGDKLKTKNLNILMEQQQKESFIKEKESKTELILNKWKQILKSEKIDLKEDNNEEEIDLGEMIIALENEDSIFANQINDISRNWNQNYNLEIDGMIDGNNLTQKFLSEIKKVKHKENEIITREQRLIENIEEIEEEKEIQRQTQKILNRHEQSLIFYYENLYYKNNNFTTENKIEEIEQILLYLEKGRSDKKIINHIIYFSIEERLFCLFKDLLQEKCLKNEISEKIENLLLKLDDQFAYIESHIKNKGGFLKSDYSKSSLKKFNLNYMKQKVNKISKMSETYQNDLSWIDNVLNSQHIEWDYYDYSSKDLQTLIKNKSLIIDDEKIKFYKKFIKRQIILSPVELLLTNLKDEDSLKSDKLIWFLETIFGLEIFNEGSIRKKFFEKYLGKKIENIISHSKFGEDLLTNLEKYFSLICLAESDHLRQNCSDLIVNKIFRKAKKSEKLFKIKFWNNMMDLKKFVNENDWAFIFHLILTPLVIKELNGIKNEDERLKNFLEILNLYYKTEIGEEIFINYTKRIHIK